MPELETTDFETELSLFKHESLSQLPSEYQNLDPEERDERIGSAREALGDDVVVLGHNYQRAEIVEHADFVGDSYQLSEAASDADAPYVVFGGVTFMAETAEIITDQDQSVILPSVEASCPMAGMAEALQVDTAWETLTERREEETIIPVTYMNSYADLKAFTAKHGGAVCTSSNADVVFEWALDQGDAVLFLPDKHLGWNTAYQLDIQDHTVEWDPWDQQSSAPIDDARLILWDGYCQVHERFRPEHIERIRAENPETNVVVHPECRRSVVEAADVVGSTSTIRETVANADSGETWAIGTEIHLAKHLDRWYPEVNVEPLCGDACMDCNAMRQIDPNYLVWVLEELLAGREQNVIEVPPEEQQLASKAIDRMLELAP